MSYFAAGVKVGDAQRQARMYDSDDDTLPLAGHQDEDAAANLAKEYHGEPLPPCHTQTQQREPSQPTPVTAILDTTAQQLSASPGDEGGLLAGPIVPVQSADVAQGWSHTPYEVPVKQNHTHHPGLRHDPPTPVTADTTAQQPSAPPGDGGGLLAGPTASLRAYRGNHKDREAQSLSAVQAQRWSTDKSLNVRANNPYLQSQTPHGNAAMAHHSMAQPPPVSWGNITPTIGFPLPPPLFSAHGGPLYFGAPYHRGAHPTHHPGLRRYPPSTCLLPAPDPRGWSGISGHHHLQQQRRPPSFLPLHDPSSHFFFQAPAAGDPAAHVHGWRHGGCIHGHARCVHCHGPTLDRLLDLAEQLLLRRPHPP